LVAGAAADVCSLNNYLLFFGVPQLLFVILFASAVMLQRKLDGLFPAPTYSVFIPAFFVLLGLLASIGLSFAIWTSRTRDWLERVQPSD
jgi:hypothetical protein